MLKFQAETLKEEYLAGVSHRDLVLYAQRVGMEDKELCKRIFVPMFKEQLVADGYLRILSHYGGTGQFMYYAVPESALSMADTKGIYITRLRIEAGLYVKMVTDMVVDFHDKAILGLLAKSGIIVDVEWGNMEKVHFDSNLFECYFKVAGK